MICVALAVALGPASLAGAQDDTDDTGAGDATAEQITGVSGTFAVDGEPIPDIVITVTSQEDGSEIAETVSDADGRWIVELDDNTPITITIDPESLPEGIELRNPDQTELSPRVSVGAVRNVLFQIQAEGAEGIATRGMVEKISEAAVNGVKFGLIIAMTSVGLSLIFGTTGLVNFAHAEMVTFGAVVAWFLNVETFELQLIGAALITVVLGGVLGGVLERGIFKPLRDRGTGQFQRLVITIGLGIVMRQALLIAFGPNSKPYRDFRIQEGFDIGPISITPRDIVIIVLSVVVLLGVAFLLEATTIGKAMRAVSDNVDLAESSGINVPQVVLFVWVLGGGLAALGGVFQAATTSVNYLMGFQLLLLMFAGVILGGLGTAYGAIVGSLVVGLTTEVSTVWLSAELKYVWALAVLIIVLLFKPEGILGSKGRVG